MIYLVQHDRIGMRICAALVRGAVKVRRVNVKTGRDLDKILGPERVEHVRRSQAWKRMTR